MCIKSFNKQQSKQLYLSTSSYTWSRQVLGITQTQTEVLLHWRYTSFILKQYFKSWFGDIPIINNEYLGVSFEKRDKKKLKLIGKDDKNTHMIQLLFAMVKWYVSI